MSGELIDRQVLAAPPEARRRLRRVGWVSLCFLFVAIVVVMAICGPLLAPQNPQTQHLGLVSSGPSGAHWLGTDALGRDVFSRVVVGSRTAFFGPLAIAVGSFVLGNVLGLLAGYCGGRVDALIMRWVDLMWSIPTLLVVIVVAGAIGASYWWAVVLLLVLSVPFDTRIVRGATLEQVPRPYVEAAKTLGVPGRWIVLKHIWPNISSIAIANTFLVFASSLVALAGLSFLGLGVSPGIADWGLMLSENETLLFANPVATIVPGVMIALTATSMNLIGDWLDDYLAGRGAGR
jgi:peptide/nickel transport system permease protein